MKLWLTTGGIKVKVKQSFNDSDHNRALFTVFGDGKCCDDVSNNDLLEKHYDFGKYGRWPHKCNHCLMCGLLIVTQLIEAVARLLADFWITPTGLMTSLPTHTARSMSFCDSSRRREPDGLSLGWVKHAGSTLSVNRLDTHCRLHSIDRPADLRRHWSVACRQRTDDG